MEFVLVLVPETPVLLSPGEPTSSFVTPICIAILSQLSVSPLSILALLAHLCSLEEFLALLVNFVLGTNVPLSELLNLVEMLLQSEHPLAILILICAQAVSLPT